METDPEKDDLDEDLGLEDDEEYDEESGWLASWGYALSHHL